MSAPTRDDAEHRIARLEAELGEEQRRSQHLFETAPVAHAATDMSGLILQVNRAAVALLGHRRGMLEGKPLQSLVLLEDRAKLRHLLLDLARGAPPAPLRLRLGRNADDALAVDAVPQPERRGGEVRSVRWTLLPTAEPPSDDRLEYVAELRASTLAIESQRAILHATLEQLPQGVLVVDRDGAPLLVNAALRAVLGNEPVESLLASDGAVARSLHRRTAVHDDELLLRPDAPHPISLAVRAVAVRGPHGHIEGAVAVFHDRGRVEQREQAQREFVDNAAHALQNPLTVIATAIEILESGAKDDPEERDRFLAHIQRETVRLNRLTRALLRLARTNVDGEPVRSRVVELAPLLEAVAGGVRPAGGVTLSVRCAPELAVLTSAELLEEALANLVENAVRHTDAGSIVVAAEPSGSSRAIVSVSDTGSGVAATDRGRIFDRFQRGANPSHGSGLGLAIVRQIADVLQADLQLQSTPGAGTTVSLTLPAARLVRQ